MSSAASPGSGPKLDPLVELLAKAIVDTGDRLVFVDGVPKVHRGDVATAQSVLSLVDGSPSQYRVFFENPCHPDDPCELMEQPRVLKHGIRLQTIARDGNLGREASGGGGAPPPLAAQLRDLEAEGYEVTVTDAGKFFVVTVAPVELPAGLAGGKSPIMLLVPRMFPTAALDMFYIPAGIKGSSPEFAQRANTIETHAGAQWRRVSWHRTAPWRPGQESLSSYLAFVRDGLRRIG